MMLAAAHHTILAILFAVIGILLIIVILLQRGRGVGLAGAFGGAGGGTAFGAKTGDVLTWVTVVGAVLLLGFTVILNFVFVESGPGLSGPPAISPARGAGAGGPAGESEAADPTGGGSPPSGAREALPGDGAPAYAGMIFGGPLA